MTTIATTLGTTTADTYGLTPNQLDQLGRELDAIRQRLGRRPGPKKTSTTSSESSGLQRLLEVAGRGSLFLGWIPPMWLLGTAALGFSKILDNMEIGHNVDARPVRLDPRSALSATGFEWDSSPAPGSSGGTPTTTATTP